VTAIPFIIIGGGLVTVKNAIRGVKPTSLALWGKNESGNPINNRERISWAILGMLMLLVGAWQLWRHYSSQ
jgi:hypothetical protein